MATFKPVIRTHHKRQDGTYNLKIRMTHNRVVRFLPTQWYVTKDDITKSLKIKNLNILDAADALIREYRAICNSAGDALGKMSVDEVVEMLKNGSFTPKAFDLDIVDYTRKYADKLLLADRKGTASTYLVAANSLVRYAKKESVSIFELTPSFLSGWIKWIGEQPPRKGRKKGGRAPSLYIAAMRAMYNRAKIEFNDEDGGEVNIPHYPFAKIQIPRIPLSRKRALTADQIAAIAALPDQSTLCPGVNRFNFARDVFMLSFYLVGMNATDLYHATDYQDGRITYERMKTKTRRADRAEISIKVEPEVVPLIEKYRDPTGKRVFNFHQLYSSTDTFTAALNYGLKKIGAILGIEDLEFYAARHSWATIAVNDAGVDKYTVHEALNHVDPAMRVTDIYIKKNWSNIDRANRAVIDLVFSPKG